MGARGIVLEKGVRQRIEKGKVDAIVCAPFVLVCAAIHKLLAHLTVDRGVFFI